MIKTWPFSLFWKHSVAFLQEDRKNMEIVQLCEMSRGAGSIIAFINQEEKILRDAHFRIWVYSNTFQTYVSLSCLGNAVWFIWWKKKLWWKSRGNYRLVLILEFGVIYTVCVKEELTENLRVNKQLDHLASHRLHLWCEGKTSYQKLYPFSQKWLVIFEGGSKELLTYFFGLKGWTICRFCCQNCRQKLLQNQIAG